MTIDVTPASYAQIEALRELYRAEANCQLVGDSILRRGMADAYLLTLDNRLCGYGGVWNRIDPLRLMEFYVVPEMRRFALPLYRALITKSGATSAQCQTNVPLSLTMFLDCVTEIHSEAILFADAATTQLECPGATFRARRPDDVDTLFPSRTEPDGDWVLEVGGELVATGGFLTHYNPPYADLYMEVAESRRGKGYGSFLVQELKRVCYEAGKRPAARCNPQNVASRATLQRAGLLPCGRWLWGPLDTV